MKNLHILPTNKPSRLYKFEDKLIKNDLIGLYDFEEKKYITQHIYTTSDEEIKDGDWVLNIEENTIFKPSNAEVYDIKNSEAKYYEFCKKIILTTDQDLDGVQVIDDDFLEWFVKNPSCEEVEIVKGFRDGTAYGYNFLDYKIIIPKEELKQNKTCVLCDGTGETTFSGTYNSQRKCDLCNGKGYIGLDIIKQAEEDLQLIKSLQEPKQETLEEVAEKLYPKSENQVIDFANELKREGFLKCAKWQEERSDIKSNKIIEFLDNEAKLKISDTKTIERIKWYFETYFEESKKK